MRSAPAILAAAVAATIAFAAPVPFPAVDTSGFVARHTFAEQAALDAAVGVVAPERKDFIIRLRPAATWAGDDRRVRRTVTRVFKAGAPLQLRINCGAWFTEPGWEYTDPRGDVWLADCAAVGGGTVTRDAPPEPAAAPRPDSEIYRTERYGLTAYRIPVPAGTYTLRLHFAECHTNAVGGRVFDVSVNGQARLTDLDVLKEAGRFAVPLTREFDGIKVTNGGIEIAFARKQQEPMINGIEVLGEAPLREDFSFETGSYEQGLDDPASLPDPGKALYRVDVGVPLSDAWRLRAGDVTWLPDCARSESRGYGFIGGAAGARGPYLAFTGAPFPGPYRSERYGLKAYEFDVPNGSYSVRLHVAEGFECVDEPGGRVFDVGVQGRTVIRNMDPFASGGGLGRASAFDVTGVRVDNGVLSIGFSNRVNSAAVTALEVFEGRAGDAAGVRQVLGPAQRVALRPAPQAKLCRVLHIGNSHTFFWAIPESVAAMLNTAQRDVWVAPSRYLHGGWALSHFLDPTRDGALGSLKAIAAGRYDVVVVQDTFGAMNPRTAATWRQYLANNARYAQAVRESGGRMVMYLVDSPAAWPQGEEARAALLEFAKANDVVLVPAGEAWQAAYKAPPPAGFISHNDGVHVGVHTAYLTACLFWIAWTGQSPEGNPRPFLVGQELRIDDAMARWIESFAWRFCRDYGERHGVRFGILGRK